MQKRELQRTVYELRGPSTAQGLALTVILGLWVALAWWLLLGGGLVAVQNWLRWIGKPAGGIRRICLATAFSIYYVRIIFAKFVFLRRGMGWTEVFTISFWLLFIFLFLSFAAGTNPSPFGPAGSLGTALFLGGSWMHSCSEHSRHAWKQRPENRGKLYTEGLFRYSRHPNYLGDLILFSGMCLIAGKWIAATIPVLMLAGFIFVNIPVLDSHLRDHYGTAFDSYALRTKKLIPFLY
jgi:protein-S-isoprenylcysteine O-methyltransferase Ste14